jgi:hypothetical protein
MRVLLALLFCSCALAYVRCDPDSGFVQGVNVGKQASRAYCAEQARNEGADLATVQKALRSQVRAAAADGYMRINFMDYHPAPCDRPGMSINQFTGLGISFHDNSWAIVSECGNYGVSGNSAPNMITQIGTKRSSSLSFSFAQSVSVAGIFCGCNTPVSRLDRFSTFPLTHPFSLSRRPTSRSSATTRST